jgi:hypothetical protein
MAAFVLHTALHREPSVVVALVSGLALLALSRLDAEDVAKDFEWPTLIFFAGLFIMVGGLGQYAHHREADAGRRPLRSGRWRATGTAGRGQSPRVDV